MLGCQDFCGYYDWTFHYIRRRFGEDAVRELWADAIGHDAQQHYRHAGLREGLKGLHETWTKTGEDEQCDWTFTLDESRNVLRWDMRRCPSKGFLLENDLHADEDYCDHCMGWMIPMLAEAGVEIAVHEHNHCGQCWGEMRVKGQPHQSPTVDADIREDPRFRQGFIDRWEHRPSVPLTVAGKPAPDNAAELQRRLMSHPRIALLKPTSTNDNAIHGDLDASQCNLLVTHEQYTQLPEAMQPCVVLIGRAPDDLEPVRQRFDHVPTQTRPLLVHPYLPDDSRIDFISSGLPRPRPLLPWLIRSGAYRHEPGSPHPDDTTFLEMLARSTEQPVDIFSLDRKLAHVVPPPKAGA